MSDRRSTFPAAAHAPAFQLSVFALLAAIMLLTRTHWLSQVVHLPETSLAVFFVLGYLVRRIVAFAALFAFGFAIDVVVIYALGGSGFCFTPAYWMLLPAYGALWLAGRFAADHLPAGLPALPVIAVIVTLAAFASDVLSSGGFYFLGGRFEDPTLAGFVPRIQRYFPGTLVATLLWTGVAAALYALVLTLRPDWRREVAK